MASIEIGSRVEARAMHGTTPVRIVGNVTDVTNVWVELDHNYVVSRDNVKLFNE